MGNITITCLQKKLLNQRLNTGTGLLDAKAHNPNKMITIAYPPSDVAV